MYSRAYKTCCQILLSIDGFCGQGDKGTAILPCSDVVGEGHNTNLEVFLNEVFCSSMLLCILLLQMLQP